MEVHLTFVDSANGKNIDGIDRVDCAMSLYRWLVTDPELRGLAEVSTASVQPCQGHMGGALEVVNVILGNTIALGNLLVAVAAWHGSRPRPPQVRLERDGVTVTVQDSSPEMIEQILRVWDTDNSGNGPEPDHGDSE